MDIVERVRGIILKPTEAWRVIAQESTDLRQLYVPYLLTLAAVPALANFIGYSLVGVGGRGLSLRVPLVSGLGIMLSQYVMTLVMVGVWGWLISQLAPAFGGQRNPVNGLKLSVYASTPALAAGVFGILPGLAILTALGALYSLYVLYLGLPLLMKNPSEKTLPYIVVAAVLGIAGNILVAGFSSVLIPAPNVHLP